ncbi:PREDICTED: uncharacterized protein LOC105565870 [Vollenhovia emeryi]|uniref:uncharacterized protein LOC105565870 n=1 Tax=Vollenhovia emeryi TaxID=411798 RepID=UPI0005F5137C|nr:PREDICTED: uncharacterized protein LOC105565870 [Vollenhovia emeryi]
MKHHVIFAKKDIKKHKGRLQPLQTGQKEILKENLHKYSEFLKDSEVLKNLGTSPNEIHYHKICRVDFFNKLKAIATKRLQTSYHISRNCHEKAFEEICSFIEENVLAKEHCYLWSYLNNYYMAAMTKFAGHDDEYSITFNEQHLQNKIIRKYENEIKIMTMHNKKIVMPINHTIDDGLFSLLKDKDILQNAALILRRQILNIRKTALPTILKTTDLLRGECSIPQEITDFYTTLLGGFQRRRRTNINCQRKIKSLSEDLIYAVKNGKIKTRKHITLGMTLKSLTSSRKIIDITNRYGHCCSYNVIEELGETEVTFSSINRGTICPEGISLSPDLFTGVAFDNFDRYVDTTSGKDTLHDTVGIIYQNICVQEYAPESFEVSIASGSKRRRTFDTITPELTSYNKRARMEEVLLPNEGDQHQSIPENLQLIKKLDALWMLSHALKVSETPMWVGFNSRFKKGINSSKQKKFVTLHKLTYRLLMYQL